MFDANKLHVVFAADNQFAEMLGISIVSLLTNNQNMEQICVYILDGGISDENKKKIEYLCEQYNRTLPVWIQNANINEMLNLDVYTDRGSLSQYARLFIAGAMPENLSRVLYLDCDIIINQSIAELWTLDLKGNTIGALMDAFSKYYRGNIELQPMDIMFNSGVMLIDLDKWKEKDIEGKLKEFIIKKKGKIQQGDQGVLNAVLSKETFCFEPRFNAVTLYFDFTFEEIMQYRKTPEFYSQDEIKKATEQPVIIHYTTSFLSDRPWVEGCKHRYVDSWLKYKVMTPWANEKMRQKQKKKGLSGLYAACISKMPRKFMIWFSGILQAYGRPLVFKFLYK